MVTNLKFIDVSFPNEMKGREKSQKEPKKPSTDIPSVPIEFEDPPIINYGTGKKKTATVNSLSAATQV